jgi:multidrug efflux system membrane fusion protein
MRTVKPGVTEGSDMSVDSGLAAGELVVTDGTDKLQNGTKVEVRTAQPVYQKTPV